MNQEIINSTDNGLSKISFQQKSTALSLIITGSATAYYFSQMWPMRPAALESDLIPAGFGGLVLTTIGLVIIAQIVLQTVLVIGGGSASAATAHEKMAELKATRNAYVVLAVGIFAAVGSVFWDELTLFCTANLAILAFLLAEIVKGGSQLIYGRA